MPKLIINTIFFLITTAAAFAQGFDWQHSSRMPTGAPDVFFGVTLSGSAISDKGDIGLFEDYLCTNLTSGNGIGINIGIAGEIWLDASLALGAGIQYGSAKSTLKKQATYPMVESNLITEYSFESTQKMLIIDFYAKKTIAETHFFIGVDLGCDVVFSNSNVFKENVISPATWPWLERELFKGSIDDYSPFNISIAALAGIDFNLGLDTYGTIAFETAYNFGSVLKNDDWNRLSFGLKVSLLHGFFTGWF
jgi:hypothetical protein